VILLGLAFFGGTFAGLILGMVVGARFALADHTCRTPVEASLRPADPQGSESVDATPSLHEGR
jgi:hypothetical protein